MDAQLDWDLLQTFAAVARSGSLSGGALARGVHHSTVSRQMATLEERLQTRLIERRARGIELTTAGEALHAEVLGMEERAFAALRAVAGQDVQLEGAVRFTTTDELLFVVAPLLRSFLDAYPRITLHLDTDSALRDLTRREADVALRAGRQPPEEAIARRIAQVEWAVFGRSDAGPAWIDPRAAYTGELPVATTGPILPTQTVSTAVQAIRAGLGRGPLPTLVGRADPDLVELEALAEPHPSHLWLLVHPDLRTTARVRALVEHLAAGLAARCTER
jgi:DNA-binding transcriptional LysR family regulator